MTDNVKKYTYMDRSFANEQAMILFVLDKYRCYENLAWRYLDAWRLVSREATLTGGLRVVCGRERLHAEILEERLRELGGQPTMEAPPERYSDIEYYGSTEHGDIEKLSKFASVLRVAAQDLDDYEEMIQKIDDDQDTRALLRGILDDEHSTLKWALESWEAYDPSRSAVS